MAAGGRTHWVVTLDEESEVEPAWAACLRALPGLQDVRVLYGAEEPTSVYFSAGPKTNVRMVGDWANLSFGQRGNALMVDLWEEDAQLEMPRHEKPHLDAQLRALTALRARYGQQAYVPELANHVALASSGVFSSNTQRGVRT